ncbi:MAG TPA: hypothetical protein VMH86_15870 [Rhizomicrobium sp.]|nr:hypothetical protein [Rhizomicrobium sp.]
MNDNTQNSTSGPSTGGAAEALALGAASRERADRFLDEQTRVAAAQAELIRLQAEDFRADERVRRRTLRLEHSSAAMKLAFEVAVALIVLLLVVIVGSALWSAAHDDGLVIEAFSVPPDMAGRGLTGDVVASHLLDKLAQLQAQTGSNRAASSYANNWGSDIKVQIPDTGISIGQAYQYLAQWLGHRTYISGEVFREPGGAISVTARVGADASPAFTGPESDFDTLLQKAAESVYRKTQPYRYAVYLSNNGREKEAEAAYRGLILDGSPEDRAWAYIGLSTIYQAHGDIGDEILMLRKALDVIPNFPMSYINWSSEEDALQHDQEAYDIQKTLAGIVRAGNASGMDARALAIQRAQLEGSLAGAVDDFQAQLGQNRAVEKLPEYAGQVENTRESDILINAFLHDGAGVRAALASVRPRTGLGGINFEATTMLANFQMDRLDAAQTEDAAVTVTLAQLGKLGALFVHRAMWPVMANIEALKGDTGAADALIARTPLDCDLCVRTRGRIAAIERRWDAAAYWFSMVSARSPAIPNADCDWGAMLLAKGDAPGAIARFESAHAKGPRWADPLEGWGEGLMMQKRSDLALAKFAEADKYAPNWGRLHLKWGEALLWSGDKAGARAQFAAAATLALTPSETSELARMRDHD